MPVTDRDRIVALPAEREADVQQAKLFHSLLAERRAELCDRLDEQAIKLSRHERNGNSEGARRKRAQIAEVGAELRDIDRMMQGLRCRLLGNRDVRAAGGLAG